MTTTEIAMVPLLAGTSISDSDHKMLKETFAHLHKVDGFQSFRFGIPLESPENLQILIDWDSREHHEAFAASPAYNPWLQRLNKAIDTSKAAFHHVDFQSPSSLSKVTGAPFTETTTFFFGDSGPDENWLDDAARVAGLMKGEYSSTSASGFVDVAYGITHEELSRKGAKGKAGVVLVGWKSEAARDAFQATHACEEWLGRLEPDAEAVEVLLVAFGQSAE